MPEKIEKSRPSQGSTTCSGSASTRNPPDVDTIIAPSAAIWLRIGQTVNADKWDQWWRSYFSHADKQAASILAWAQANQREEYEKNWHDIHKRIDKAAARVAYLREKIMYVNFDEGKFVSPLEDKEIKKDFDEELGFAEWLWKWLS